MNTKQVYERVQMVTNISEREFFDRLNDTIGELNAIYGEVPKLLWVNYEGGFPPEVWIKKLDDKIDLLPLYHEALSDNILYLSGAGSEYRQEFLMKARNAYLTYWNRNAKGRRVKN